MHILPCKQERLYTYGEIGGTLAEPLSYVLSTLEGSSDTFGHYFSDIIYTSAVRYFPDKGKCVWGGCRFCIDCGRCFGSLSWVMVLAPFPTIFFLMWNRNLQLTRNLKEAMEMNGHLSRRISPEVGIASLEDKVFSSEEALVFAGGTKEMLEVKAGDFLYAEAKGNYVKVGYRSDSDKEKKITWRLLRATMKQAEEAVSACPFIIRCHRAFLVNIRMVVKVDGNSQGYKLNLEGCEEEVPVSRAYAKEVKALIENRTKS